MNIEKVIQKFDSLIDTLPETRKDQVKNMMNHIQERYFTSPASYRKELHDAFPGGLAFHSLQVTATLLKMSAMLDPSIPKDSIIICGLFHDLGKIGTIAGENLYSPAVEQWKIEKGQVYDYNKNISDGLTHAQRSVRILSHYGVYLTEDEYVSILAHDGLGKEENSCFNWLKSKLALLLHWSDHWSYISSVNEGEKNV